MRMNDRVMGWGEKTWTGWLVQRFPSERVIVSRRDPRGCTIREVAGTRGCYPKVTLLNVPGEFAEVVEQRLDFVYHVNVCQGALLIRATKGRS